VRIIATLVRKAKRELRFLLAGILFYSGILALRRLLRKLTGPEETVCVLGLHRVLSDAEAARSHSLPGMILRERTFDELLAYLEKRYLVLSLEEFLAGGRGAWRGQKPAALLTFDDGWWDNYSRAFPALQRRRMPAVIFLVTGLVGTSKLFWVERLVRTWSTDEGRGRVQSAWRTLDLPKSAGNDVCAMIEHLKHLSLARRDEVLASLLAESPPPPVE
jgi:hypothetical protein